MRGFRSDIQGLRAVAVSAVLLYHLWPRWRFSAQGYLGVDIFFVISGHLVRMLMEGAQTASGFYFRRVRRILPAYAGVLVTTVVAAWFVMLASEVGEVVRGARTSLLFASNRFNLPKLGYFAEHNHFPLFLHTWSLSVEMQFYAMVPLLFGAARMCSALWNGAGNVMLLSIGVVSLTMQWILQDDPHAFHMAVYCRIWQFLLGFLSFSVHQWITCQTQSPNHSEVRLLIEPETKNNVPRYDKQTATIYSLKSIYQFVLHHALLMMLVLQLVHQFSENKFVTKVMITFTCAALLSTSTRRSVLNYWAFVSLGNVSYSVYLVHWPLFTLHRYVFYYVYAGSDGPVLQDALALLNLTLGLAYVFESVHRAITAHLTSWKTLAPTLTAFYLTFFIATSFISSSDHNSTVTEKSATGLDEMYLKLYEARGLQLDLSANDKVKLNMDMQRFMNDGLDDCKRQRDKLGEVTDFREDLDAFEFYSKAESNGTKEMVVFGNSISHGLFYGIRHQFKGVYRNLHLVGRSLCLPLLKQLNRVGAVCNATCVDVCGRFADHIVPLLQRWKRPIDVIVAHFAYEHLRSTPFNETDEVQRGLQDFFSRLSRASEAVVVVPSPELQAPFTTQSMLKSISMGRDTNELNVRLADYRSQTEGLRRRLASLSCPNCLRMGYERALCAEVDGWCRMVSAAGLAHHHDYLHPTPLGALHYARALREEYDRRVGSGS